ncbi:MAG: alpha/beta hydrolase [Proteobacteria bacterium]|nr:alpha/beta hydrolase [Pseudomonadota bacterium]
MPEITINGPEGRIEARYLAAKVPNAPIALFLHPHPLHGGTMNNKVVYSLYQTFLARGFSCLRFNFRGVGRSQGTFSRGEGEMSDAAAALDWLQANNQDSPQCWIAGFSFGAWIGMQLLMRRPEITGFISVAPPANMYDFSFLAPCPASGLIVQGDKDEIVPADSVQKLIDKLRQQKGVTISHEIVPGANHFFNGRMDELIGHVGSYMDTAMVENSPAN